MVYLLDIINVSCGEKTVSSVEAEGGFSDGKLGLSYIFDGAEYFLKIERGKIRQSRRGGICIDMEFVCGKHTKAHISGEGVSGTFPIFTELLEVSFDGESCTAECVFSGLGDGERTELKIFARAIDGTI